VRIGAARGITIGAGVEGQGQSRFTAAYISALSGSPGDMRRDGHSFVSDRAAFDGAVAMMRMRWGHDLLPLEIGLFGGVPLMRSEALRVMGSGKFTGLSRRPGLSVRVRYVLVGRRHVPTVLSYLLADAADQPLAEGTIKITPDTDTHISSTRIRVSARGVLRSIAKGGQVVPLRWHLELRDVFGHSLARRRFTREYAAPA
jgi:hypothetical protein